MTSATKKPKTRRFSRPKHKKEKKAPAFKTIKKPVFNSNLNNALSLASEESLLCALSSISHLRPSTHFLNDLLKKFHLLVTAETKNQEYMMKFSSHGSTTTASSSATGSTAKASDNFLADRNLSTTLMDPETAILNLLRAFQIIISHPQHPEPSQSTIKDFLLLKQICIPFFAFHEQRGTSNTTSSASSVVSVDNSLFLQSLRYEAYLHFWLLYFEQEIRVYKVAKDQQRSENFIFTSQYMLSRSLQQFFENQQASLKSKDQTIKSFLEKKAPSRAIDIEESVNAACVTELRKILMQWMTMDELPPLSSGNSSSNDPRRIMNLERCAACASKIYAHCMWAYEVPISSICEDLSDFRYLSMHREFLHLLAEWPHGFFKLNVLRYLYYAWVGESSRNDKKKKDVSTLLKIYCSEVSAREFTRHYTAENWYALVVLLREMARTVLLSGCIASAKGVDFFSPKKGTKTEKRQRWLPLLKKHAKEFKNAFSNLSEQLKEENVRIFITDTLSDTGANEIDMDADAFIQMLANILTGSILEVEALLEDDFQSVVRGDLENAMGGLIV